MPRMQVAHIHEQGVDLIIPLDDAFGRKLLLEQQAVVAELHARAMAAGLAGTVVPIWDDGSGRMGFLAPLAWHPFFRSLDLLTVAAMLNRELFW